MPRDYNLIRWRDIIYYDETSPTFLRWKTQHPKDSVAGHTDKHGYSSVRYAGKLYFNHRIIWILFYDSIDNGMYIDHIDGNRKNNRVSNLRLVTRIENNRNTSAYKNNKTGVRGVCIINVKGVPTYYAASWYTLNGEYVRKYFSISKYNAEVAFDLACKCRENAIKEINALGAGYTKRHLNNQGENSV